MKWTNFGDTPKPKKKKDFDIQDWFKDEYMQYIEPKDDVENTRLEQHKRKVIQDLCKNEFGGLSIAEIKKILQKERPENFI